MPQSLRAQVLGILNNEGLPMQDDSIIATGRFTAKFPLTGENKPLVENKARLLRLLGDQLASQNPPQFVKAAVVFDYKVQPPVVMIRVTYGDAPIVEDTQYKP